MSELDGRWQLSVNPDPLLPGRPAHLTLRFTPDADLDARGASAVLRCIETYRYDTSETTTGADGRPSTRQVTRTEHDEIQRVDYELQGPGPMAAGQPLQWTLDLDVPGLGPASFEGEELRCDWTFEAKVDLPMKVDERYETILRVAQPTALLKAGVVDVGQYGLFQEAPTNVDAFPAQVRMEPVPVCLLEPFAGSFTVETREPIEVQEVRLELRVKVQVTVSGGREEEILVQRGHLEADGGRFGGTFAVHRFTADAAGAWLPTVDLPHGTARGVFHVILARAWERDIHYVRDVALATTSEL